MLRYFNFSYCVKAQCHQLSTTNFRQLSCSPVYRRKQITLKNAVESIEIKNCEEDLAKLAEQYPHAHGTLNNIMAVVAKEIKNPKSFDVTYKALKTSKHLTGWTCSCHLDWPTAISFTATGKTKQDASRVASLKVLQWLVAQGRIKGTKPILLDRKAVATLRKSDVHIVLNQPTCHNLRALAETYDHEIAEIISREESAVDVSRSQFVHEDRNGFIMSNLSETQRAYKAAARNRKLERQALARTAGHNDQEALPIHAFREKILTSINSNQVVIIKGEPGCGKSTQVPQYILDEAAMAGRACEASVIVTQPRRISAISLAERVAQERQEQVGDSVGYHVRFKARLPRHSGGFVRFCSSGILLKMLQSNPTLQGFSHIILDEAHERDVNTDMLMLLLKRVLASNSALKLIIMSATINPELFQRYYMSAAALHIPGFTHPVQSYYLDDIRQVSLSQTRMSQEQKTPRVFHQEVASMIEWIHAKKPDGAILCFLPGWQDIKTVSKHLEKNLKQGNALILPLHSRLTLEEQARVFRRPPPGLRKIVLSTNVAETSVTIDDIGYVVDSGVHKEERLSADKNSAVIDDLWVSQANVHQRRGRAGRVRSGESYHLYSKEKYRELPIFPIPELHRVPLQKVVLDIKSYNEEERADEFLSAMPEPPSTDAISRAVDDLIKLGALTTQEGLTPLGRRIARFTTDPRLSKALIHAAVFRCLEPMLTIASILSSDAELFSGALDERSDIAEIKRSKAECSDHMAILALYNEWAELVREEERDEIFCIRNMARGNTLRLISRLIRHATEQLEEAGMYSPNYSLVDLKISPEWLLGVLLSGTQTYLFQRSWDYKNGRIRFNSPSMITETGGRASLSSDCVCHKREQLSSSFLTYYRKQESAVRRTSVVRDASCIPAVALPLFFAAAKNLVTMRNIMEEGVSVLDNQRNLPFRLTASNSDAEVIRKSQAMLQDVVDYFVTVEGEHRPEGYAKVSQFRDDLVMTLSSLLQTATHTSDSSPPS